MAERARAIVNREWARVMENNSNQLREAKQQQQANNREANLRRVSDQRELELMQAHAFIAELQDQLAAYTETNVNHPPAGGDVPQGPQGQGQGQQDMPFAGVPQHVNAPQYLAVPQVPQQVGKHSKHKQVALCSSIIKNR